MCVGKDYTLLHAAPIVAVFILDHVGVPVPCPYEVENRVVPAPDMHTPHFALICTQEQLKVKLQCLAVKGSSVITITISLRNFNNLVNLLSSPLSPPLTPSARVPAKHAAEEEREGVRYHPGEDPEGVACEGEGCRSPSWCCTGLELRCSHPNEWGQPHGILSP